MKYCDHDNIINTHVIVLYAFYMALVTDSLYLQFRCLKKDKTEK